MQPMNVMVMVVMRVMVKRMHMQGMQVGEMWMVMVMVMVRAI